MTGRIAASGNVNSLLEEDEETARTMSLTGKSYCYGSLFRDCRSLTSAPELPAMELASKCYYGMFLNTSLIQAPELPAMVLDSYCYQDMFTSCSLTSVPELPATTLVTSCYNRMFVNCKSLNYVKVGFTDWTPSNATTSWFQNVSGTGTFECPQELIDNTTSRTDSTVPSNWTMTPPPPPEERWELCFEAEEPGTLISLVKFGEMPTDINIQTKRNDEGWQPYTVTSTGEYIELFMPGDKVYFRGDNQTISMNQTEYHQFQVSGSAIVSGNLNSLLTTDRNMAESIDLNGRPYCYYKLFADIKPIRVHNLVITGMGMSDNFANSMFQNSGTIESIEIMSPDLMQECYSNMFQGINDDEYATEITVHFTNWMGDATNNWLDDKINSAGWFFCPQELINNTPDEMRNNSTVPSEDVGSWFMEAR